jgi:ABC-type transporter Mla subunit MlaD
MIETLEKSLDQISKSANGEIVAALENVVKDFNKNLTEQFGQNFKDLNGAVRDMVVWQNNYKTIIKQYEESLQDVITNLEYISQIKDKQEENIDNLIQNLSKTSDDITKSLKESTDIVEESLQLLLREANGKL